MKGHCRQSRQGRVYRHTDSIARTNETETKHIKKQAKQNNKKVNATVKC